MNNRHLISIILLLVLLIGIAIGVSSQPDGMLATAIASSHDANAGPSPVRALTERDVYYPGTEDLGPDEMRVVALGTGMPTIRPKQAAACFLVELGNGDKFLFDIGYGSVERLAAMKIPMDFLDKVFIGHSAHGPLR